MSVYIPNAESGSRVAHMLGVIGADSVDELFRDIPEEIVLQRTMNLPSPRSEHELLGEVRTTVCADVNSGNSVCFMGAGAYDRLIPAAIRHLTQRSEFFTAYTPYQPEISQGTLSVIFEFQTMIASLTGMDVANASMYDGASACAEAMLMATNRSKCKRILISSTVHPEAREVVSTYARFNGIEVAEVAAKNGVTDMDDLKVQFAKGAAGLIQQSPNFFGLIEDFKTSAEIAHESDALLVAYNADPLSLALLRSPGDSGADIAVGEGQSFGIGLNYGGPYLGFMAAKSKFMRKMPGRIVGETVDVNGQRSFVLTLQTREQHIRREKATSNICSNQGLNATTAVIYLALLGKTGFKKAAEQSLNKAHYLCAELEKTGRMRIFDGPFFDEFALWLNTDAKSVMEKLLSKGFLAGYPLANHLHGLENAEKTLLLCATEKRTKAEIDSFVAAIEEVDV